MKHAEQLKTLFKRLLKENKPQPLEKIEPLDALVRGAMSFDVSDRRAAEALRAIEREFVDLNELRVATDLEIQELLGNSFPDIVKRVYLITQSLNAIFEREHTLSLDRLRTVNKRDARAFLHELPEMHPFVEAFVMLFALDANAIPIDDRMADLLKARGIIEPEMTLEEVQRFCEHHIKAEQSYEFYSVLRAAAAQHAGESTPAAPAAKPRPRLRKKAKA